MQGLNSHWTIMEHLGVVEGLRRPRPVRHTLEEEHVSSLDTRYWHWHWHWSDAASDTTANCQTKHMMESARLSFGFREAGSPSWYCRRFRCTTLVLHKQHDMRLHPGPIFFPFLLCFS